VDLARYTALFLSDSRDHLQRCNALLLEWERTPESAAPVAELFRSFHSIKGSSATLGFDDVAYLAHQNIHELPGKSEHRMNRALPSELRVQVRHPIAIQSGGLLEKLMGRTGEVMVNSLHAQSINQPADGLFVEALSDDEVVEAVSMPGAKGFVLGVQWHPEHRVPRSY
jgi:putative glutamine amidotransferase